MDIFVNFSETNDSRVLKNFRYMCLIKVHPHEQFGIDPDQDLDLRIIKPFKNMPYLKVKVNREVNFAHMELKLGMNVPKDMLLNISSVFSLPAKG